MNASPSFAFFGTPLVARDTLHSLLESGFVPTVVITNPDAPKGRGLVLAPSPVKELAVAHGIPVLTPETLDEAAQEAVVAYGCAYAVVVAYGKIFPEELITAFPMGVLNVHYSLLPKYRGATPMEAALLAGDAVTGVTVQKMVRELDAGDILAQSEVPIGPEETARELRPRLIQEGARLLVETLPRFVEGDIVPIPQDHTRATRARKFSKDDGRLDLSGDSRGNWNTYRAYADTIGTHFFTEEGTRVKIVSASFKGDAFVPLTVIPEGKNEMPYADFVRSGK